MQVFVQVSLTFSQCELFIRWLPLWLALGKQLFHGFRAFTEILYRKDKKSRASRQYFKNLTSKIHTGITN